LSKQKGANSKINKRDDSFRKIGISPIICNISRTNTFNNLKHLKIPRFMLEEKRRRKVINLLVKKKHSKKEIEKNNDETANFEHFEFLYANNDPHTHDSTLVDFVFYRNDRFLEDKDLSIILYISSFRKRSPKALNRAQSIILSSLREYLQFSMLLEHGMLRCSLLSAIKELKKETQDPENQLFKETPIMLTLIAIYQNKVVYHNPRLRHAILVMEELL